MGMCHRTAGCRGFGSYSKGGDRIREIGKLMSDFSSIVLSRGCPEKGSAALVIWLNSTSLSVRVHLRPGTCYVLALTELQCICRMGTQGDRSLLDAWAEMR